jgi:transcriptional regulator with XRE-family HTH domain
VTRSWVSGIRSDTILGMEAGAAIRTARDRAGLSLRQLARRAQTSHSTLSAYEAGDKVPTVTTLARIVRAAGFALDLELAPRVDGPDREAKGRELVEVLELAAQFPARHEPTLSFPPFRRER